MVTLSYFIIPIKQNKKAEVEYYTCNKTNECPLYSKGKCACFRYLLGSNQECPNAEYHHEIGPTKRAQSYNNWVTSAKYLYSSTAKEYKEKIALVADYIFIPISYLESYWTSAKVNGVINKYFFKLENFDSKKIQEIVTYKPRNLYGDIVDNYEERNKFILQLKEVCPDLYTQWVKDFPDTAKNFINLSNIGRTAYIYSLPDGYIDRGFIKEGNYLINTELRDSLFRGKFGSELPLNIKIEINKDMTVKITDKNTTDKNTVFVD